MQKTVAIFDPSLRDFLNILSGLLPPLWFKTGTGDLHDLPHDKPSQSPTCRLQVEGPTWDPFETRQAILKCPQI